MSAGLQFRSWRVFMLVCFLPAVAALAGLVFMPESPRYLLEVMSMILHIVDEWKGRDHVQGMDCLLTQQTSHC